MVRSKGRGWFGFRSAVPGIALLLMITFVGSGNALATTFYISKSAGSDSNNGTSKSTPWAHLPGMAGATSNAAAYSPQPGDQFILKGGDTWGSADLRVYWSWSGTSGSRIYVGVDKSWFNGASWTRPIFNCQNTTCGANNIFWIPGNYVTFDDIEVTGYQQCGNADILIWVYGNGIEVKNFYVHGWSRNTTCAIQNSFVTTNDTTGGFGVGTSFHDNVIDGSDSPNQDFMGGIKHGVTVYNNVIRYVYNGMLGNFNDVHSNLVENTYQSPTGDHCNGIFNFGPGSGTLVLMYNNVIRHTSTNSCVNSWVAGNDNPNPSFVAYVFNNVLYDLNAGNVLDIAAHPAGNYGTFYVFNNTVECGSDSNICGWPNNWNGGPYYTGHFINNHWVANSQYYCPVGSTCDYTPQLVQSISQANNTGYTSSETYAFSPTAANSPTVGQGTNLQSYCSTLAAVDVAGGAACQSDATYPTYDTVNHVVVTRSVNPRPASGAWDIGAYLYNGGNQPPNPPTALTATVN